LIDFAELNFFYSNLIFLQLCNSLFTEPVVSG
jgi:hypothetical protein